MRTLSSSLVEYLDPRCCLRMSCIHCILWVWPSSVHWWCAVGVLEVSTFLYLKVTISLIWIAPILSLKVCPGGDIVVGSMGKVLLDETGASKKGYLNKIVKCSAVKQIKIYWKGFWSCTFTLIISLWTLHVVGFYGKVCLFSYLDRTRCKCKVSLFYDHDINKTELHCFHNYWDNHEISNMYIFIFLFSCPKQL